MIEEQPKVKQPIFKALSALLDYPSSKLISYLDDIKLVIKDSSLKKPLKEDLDGFVESIKQTPILELEEQYVETFEHNRSLSLYLFEHIYSDSRDRGPAMLELKEIYKRYGISLTTNELPDYLPMFMEYLSLVTVDKSEELLNEPINIIALLKARLDKSNNKYSVILKALESLASVNADIKYVETKLKNTKQNDIDDDWLEPEAFPKECPIASAKTNALKSSKNFTGV